MTEMSLQKFRYLENEKSFYGEMKNILIIFNDLSMKQIKQNVFRR